MRQLFEAGVHFGHHVRRWNPKMGTYIFGVRNNTHIIDLQQTIPLLYRALEAIKDNAARGGRLLIVGTKRQASPVVADSAKRCGQYYVNHRWLGGTLTNWQTVSRSIKSLRETEDRLANPEGFTKKEQLNLDRARNKFELSLGGIREMGGVPDMLFIIDTNREATAVKEANKLGIPVVAILDSNSDPDGITYPIPGNDDSGRAIALYGDLIAQAVLAGLQAEYSVVEAKEGKEGKESKAKGSAKSSPKNTADAAAAPASNDQAAAAPVETAADAPSSDEEPPSQSVAANG
ncbi:MAG: 30S ribosomal protein S2 [Alphaproteobacteria bacterium]|nr:30S ribosomal protein S2 [Alphaproteobacteria bacterium]